MNRIGTMGWHLETIGKFDQHIFRIHIAETMPRRPGVVIVVVKAARTDKRVLRKRLCSFLNDHPERVCGIGYDVRVTG